MNSALAALLICSLVLYAQGQPLNGSSRCLCKGGFMKTPGRFLHLMKDVKVYSPSVFCPQTEITMKIKNQTYCVDPASKVGKFFLQKKLQSVRSTSTSTESPLNSTQATRQTSTQL